jgi:hypothetical protein
MSWSLLSSSAHNTYRLEYKSSEYDDDENDTRITNIINKDGVCIMIQNKKNNITILRVTKKIKVLQISSDEKNVDIINMSTLNVNKLILEGEYETIDGVNNNVRELEFELNNNYNNIVKSFPKVQYITLILKEKDLNDDAKNFMEDARVKEIIMHCRPKTLKKLLIKLTQHGKIVSFKNNQRVPVFMQNAYKEKINVVLVAKIEKNAQDKNVLQLSQISRYDFDYKKYIRNSYDVLPSIHRINFNDEQFYIMLDGLNNAMFKQEIDELHIYNPTDYEMIIPESITKINYAIRILANSGGVQVHNGLDAKLIKLDGEITGTNDKIPLMISNFTNHVPPFTSLQTLWIQPYDDINLELVELNKLIIESMRDIDINIIGYFPIGLEKLVFQKDDDVTRTNLRFHWLNYPPDTLEIIEIDYEINDQDDLLMVFLINMMNYSNDTRENSIVLSFKKGTIIPEQIRNAAKEYEMKNNFLFLLTLLENVQEIAKDVGKKYNDSFNPIRYHT